MVPSRSTSRTSPTVGPKHWHPREAAPEKNQLGSNRTTPPVDATAKKADLTALIRAGLLEVFLQVRTRIPDLQHNECWLNNFNVVAFDADG
jgi:hypothetical protein